MMTFQEALQVLSSIASQYPEGSKEQQAIELAAKALHFAFHEDVGERFNTFLEEFDSKLTPEQKEKLRRMGIDAGFEPSR
jgi:hypothetical protein